MIRGVSPLAAFSSSAIVLTVTALPPRPPVVPPFIDAQPVGAAFGSRQLEAAPASSPLPAVGRHVTCASRRLRVPGQGSPNTASSALTLQVECPTHAAARTDAE